MRCCRRTRRKTTDKNNTKRVDYGLEKNNQWRDRRQNETRTENLDEATGADEKQTEQPDGCGR